MSGIAYPKGREWFGMVRKFSMICVALLFLSGWGMNGGPLMSGADAFVEPPVWDPCFPENTVCIFQEDFEGGPGGFVIDNLFGEGEGLWHVTDQCMASEPGHSPSNILYYGSDPNCNYANGMTEGVVTSPVISLADMATPVKLLFNYFLETEGDKPYDSATVEVRGPNQCCEVLYGAAVTHYDNGQPISGLFRIDPTTGEPNYINDIGHEVTGLAFSPEGVLYGVALEFDPCDPCDPCDPFAPFMVATTPSNGTVSILMIIDPFLGEYQHLAYITIMGVPVPRISDISFSPGRVLYGYDESAHQLITIDTGTGEATVIGPTGYAGGGNGLAFGPGGALFATPSDANCLVQLDPDTAMGNCVPGTEGQVAPRIDALDFCLDQGVGYAAWHNDFSGMTFLIAGDINTGQPIVLPTVEGLEALAMSPCGMWNTVAWNWYGAVEAMGITYLEDWSEGWRRAMVDLTKYVGQDIRFRFRFRTLDDLYNEYSGFAVDDVRVCSLNADLDGDGCVSLFDMSMLAEHWLRMDCQGTTENAFCEYTDINMDGSVDLQDFSILSHQWDPCYFMYHLDTSVVPGWATLALDPVSGDGTYPSGTQVTLTAQPELPQWHVIEWRDGQGNVLQVGGDTYIVTMNGDMTVIAQFGFVIPD